MLLIIAVLWLCICVLASTPRQREICAVATLMALAVLALLGVIHH